MSISAQVVDDVYGRPAAGVQVRLERQDPDVGRDPGDWLPVDHAETDGDGHIHGWTADRFGRGLYQLVFDSNAYFATLGLSTAYQEVSVVVRLSGESDGCQLQIRLAPYSYSMYFGFQG